MDQAWCPGGGERAGSLAAQRFGTQGGAEYPSLPLPRQCGRYPENENERKAEKASERERERAPGV